MSELPHRIGEGGLLMGYVLSRLDRRAFDLVGATTWEEAFDRSGAALDEKATTIKALRDEFDPYFPNNRKGWRDREIRAPLLALLHELSDVSDEALIELMREALDGGREALDAVIAAVSEVPTTLADTATRIRTGRAAEEYFELNSLRLVGLSPAELVDTRLDACGFDFKPRSSDGRVFEVKGLSSGTGGLLFTDLEWHTARHRASDYVLVVVSSLAGDQPVASVVPNPVAVLKSHPRVEKRTVATWNACFLSNHVTRYQVP